MAQPTFTNVPAEDLSHGLSVESESFGQLAWKRFKRHKLALAGLILLGIIIVLTVFANYIAPYGQAQLNFNAISQGPSLQHLMGTDPLGHDQFSQLLYGGRISLTIGFVSVIGFSLIGVVVGSLAGYYGGWADQLLMRFTDVMLTFPVLLLFLLLLDEFGSNMLIVIAVIVAFSWMGIARVIRGQFLSFKEQPFAEAVRAMGANDYRIITKHLLPNSYPVILVNATLGIGGAIIYESTLSFLGLGVQPPQFSWGSLLGQNQSYYLADWWLAVFPGLFITATVLSINFIGDALRDAFDPRSRR